MQVFFLIAGSFLTVYSRSIDSKLLSFFVKLRLFIADYFNMDLFDTYKPIMKFPEFEVRKIKL